jgi:2-polyprenyl-3-methyl-5-hydroxy-6-metoxy-1,4-benzoquinol methylase
MEDKFTEIYDKSKWGKRDGKGTSGTGSSLSPDQKWYINLLMEIIKDHDIVNICDVGCGDWNFSKTIDWSNLNYTGIDCVKSVIEDNQKYVKDNVKFIHQDAGEDRQIPKGYDLVILKDVIQHWDDEEILKVLPEIIKENKFVFLCNGFMFGRDRTKNNWVKRSLDKVYHYHPIDMNKEPMTSIKNYDIIRAEQRRFKQYILVACS